MRRWMRRDGNESEIFDAMEKRGASILRISQPGLPDGVVFYQGKARPAEVKLPKGKLRKSQERFQAKWSGPDVAVLRSVDDGMALLDAMGKA